jgi:hypothetical protein
MRRVCEKGDEGRRAMEKKRAFNTVTRREKENANR